VQPLVSHIARQQQDYTAHKTDEADCVMIARLAAELHCYGNPQRQVGRSL
jgi:transposase